MRRARYRTPAAAERRPLVDVQQQRTSTPRTKARKQDFVRLHSARLYVTQADNAEGYTPPRAGVQEASPQVVAPSFGSRRDTPRTSYSDPAASAAALAWKASTPGHDGQQAVAHTACSPAQSPLAASPILRYGSFNDASMAAAHRPQAHSSTSADAMDESACCWLLAGGATCVLL